MPRYEVKLECDETRVATVLDLSADEAATIRKVAKALSKVDTGPLGITLSIDRRNGR